MNMGSFRSSPNVTRKFCRVCGTSLFFAEDGWEIIPEDKTVRMTNMYHREFRGKSGKKVDVSVWSMDVAEVKKWVEIGEDKFDDMTEGGHLLSRG